MTPLILPAGFLLLGLAFLTRALWLRAHSGAPTWQPIEGRVVEIWQECRTLHQGRYAKAPTRGMVRFAYEPGSGRGVSRLPSRVPLEVGDTIELLQRAGRPDVVKPAFLSPLARGMFRGEPALWAVAAIVWPIVAHQVLPLLLPSTTASGNTLSMDASMRILLLVPAVFGWVFPTMALALFLVFGHSLYQELRILGRGTKGAPTSHGIVRAVAQRRGPGGGVRRFADVDLSHNGLATLVSVECLPGYDIRLGDPLRVRHDGARAWMPGTPLLIPFFAFGCFVGLLMLSVWATVTISLARL
ncbi:MAG: hypothetical protein Q4G43_10600 [Mobilicoccus sp.]|nr:hypothetical protein [Mobilicoccus sp.]